MKKLYSFILVILTINQVSAQSYKQDSIMNLTAPVIKIDQNFSPKLTPDFYKGKVLVLDFWATWCAPCIASFPHMNELVDDFKNKEVVFAAISDEPDNTVNTFFKRTKKELKLTSLLDVKHRTFSNFYITAIPCCVVIDKNNKVRWIGNGADLTIDIINKVINDESLKNIISSENIKTAKNEEVPLFSFSISSVDSLGGNLASSRNRSDLGVIDMNQKNISIEDLLENLTGYSKSVRFISNYPNKLRQHIKFDYVTNNIKNKIFAVEYEGKIIEGALRTNLLINLIEESMNFEIQVIEKEMLVYELDVTNPEKWASFKSLQDRHSSTTEHDYFPRLEIVGYPLKSIASQMEAELHRIIICNIADKERHDISLDFTNIKSLKKMLEFHGLFLNEKKTKVKLLNIDFK